MWKEIQLNNIIKSTYYINEKGQIYSKLSNKILSGSLDKDGYVRISLKTEDNKQKTIKLHRILLITFNPVKNYQYLQVNHIDGNKTNNTLDNLEWCSCKKNIEHAFDIGLRTGKEHSILQEKDVIKICKLLEEGYEPKMIAIKLFPDDITKYTSMIQDIKRGKNWTSISCNYNIQVPYKYGKNFKSKNYTIWELENICYFLSTKKDKWNHPTELARIYYNDFSLSYKDSKVKLFGQLINKQKYKEVTKYYF